jgi:predicted RNA-binding protein YlqC (UPF0109 family)
MNVNKEEIERIIEDLLLRVVEWLVVYQDDVEVIKIFSDSKRSVYRVRVHAADTSRLIGTGGERFKALQFLTHAAGARFGRDVTFERIDEATVGDVERFPLIISRPDWDRGGVMNLLADMCAVIFENEAEITCQETVTGYATMEILVAPSEIGLDVISKALHSILSGIGVLVGCQILVEIKPNLK